MNASRAFAVTKRVLRDLKNDRRQLALIFIAPLLVISIFGVAFTGSVKDVRVVVVNGDTGVGIALSQIRSSPILTRACSTLRTQIVRAMLWQVQNGSASASDRLSLPLHPIRSGRASGQTSVAPANTTITLLADKSNPNVFGPYHCNGQHGGGANNPGPRPSSPSLSRLKQRRLRC